MEWEYFWRWGYQVRSGPSCPSALSVTWQTMRSLWQWPTTWLLITPRLLPVRADPDGAGEAGSYATERASACTCARTAGSPVSSACSPMLGVYVLRSDHVMMRCLITRTGWRCRLKCVHLDVHFIGIYLKSVFGFELAVWVWTHFLFYFFSFFLWLTGLPVFSNIPLVFLGKTCTVHSSSFPHQPATNNVISLQRLSVTYCVRHLACKLIFGRWARPSRVREDTLLVWAERLKPSLCLQNTWCWSWVRLSPALAAIEGQRERIALFLRLITM